ncbi:MAG: hypothetical protein U0103_24375 [Candidatus Obscuribacterales bacterium]
MNFSRDTIEHHLNEMREAAECQRYEIMELEYRHALERAEALVGVNGPLLLLLLCMANNYESQDKMIHAENFNRRAREMIIEAKHSHDN